MTDTKHEKKGNSFFEKFFGPSKSAVKIVLIGDGAVGKTSFFDRIAMGDDIDYKFNKKYDATTGCNICQMEVVINDYPIQIHLFDTAGQEKFGALRDSYLMGADGIIVMYDLHNRETKNSVLAKWVPDIQRIIKASGIKSHIPVAVVGNKSDIIESCYIQKDLKDDSMTYREIVGIRDSTLISHYSNKNKGGIKHFYMSVKGGDDLMDPINWLLKQILSYYFPVTIEKTNKKPIIAKSN